MSGDWEGVRDPAELVAGLVRRHGGRAAIGTSGQLSGTALIDMAARAGLAPHVFMLETGRLFPETLAYLETLERHFGIRIERIRPDPAEVAAMVSEYGEHLFLDGPSRQKLCCNVRKVRPLERVLDTLDVWITGLRRDQSEDRSDTERIQRIPRGDGTILKVSPLADWSEVQVRAYLDERRVPVHPLLESRPDGWRYASLGCVICTTPVAPHEPPRAGRWRWHKEEGDPRECGIHRTEGYSSAKR